MGEVQVSRGEGPKPRRQFDEAFKRDAVRLVETGNSSVRKVAGVGTSDGLRTRRVKRVQIVSPTHAVEVPVLRGEPPVRSGAITHIHAGRPRFSTPPWPSPRENQPGPPPGQLPTPRWPSSGWSTRQEAPPLADFPPSFPILTAFSGGRQAVVGVLLRQVGGGAPAGVLRR